MKIGIIHFTDMHFSIDNNHIEGKEQHIFNALKDDFLDVSTIYILISGDIAVTGNKEEYSKASSFIEKITSLIHGHYNSVPIKHIIVPGNHDCNFSKDNQSRINSLKNMNYSVFGNDGSVSSICLQVQDEFWEFYKIFNPMPKDKIFFQIIDEVEEKNICFNCHNTAWMSQRSEKPGSLFYPVKNYDKSIKSDFDLNISIFHHPLNWFNPDTKENNKIEFRKLLDSLSSIHFLGHEHEMNVKQNVDIINHTSTLKFSGKVLQDFNDKANSGFQTMFLNIELNNGVFKHYKWDTDIFILHNKEDFTYKKKCNKQNIKQEFINVLETIKIPLSMENKDINLSSLFVFPDLEAIDLKNSNKIEDYIDSENILKNDKKYYFLEGNSQVGKTSLLYMLFLKAYEKGLVPLYLKGNDINKIDFSTFEKKAYNQQYECGVSDYEKFIQLEKKNKIILIDDYHNIRLNKKYKSTLMKEILKKYSWVIVTIDTAFGITPSLQSEFNDFCCCTIKPFGYKKKNDLIEKYFYLKESDFTIEDSIILEKTKTSFDQIQQILGNKLIPSYPIFVLSILQSLEFRPLNLNQTSYGYCYQSLIHLALVKAGIVKEDIDTYINFLTELSYFSFKKKLKIITEKEIFNFYVSYEKNYIIPAYDTVKTNLLTSRIIEEYDSRYKFGYKYISYFLTAKKIAEIIETDEAKIIIHNLYSNLHLEMNANILVFITHHTKNLSFIDESIFFSMLPFEDVEPITLKTNDPYYKLIQEISVQISNDILKENVDPKIERNKHLVQKDKMTRTIEKNNQNLQQSDLDEVNKYLQPFFLAFKSIEIVGQIIKNRKGSLTKPKLIEMISELYNTGFRTISFLGKLFEEAKDDIIVTLNKQIKETDSKQDIEQKVRKFFQFFSLRVCLDVFSKLVYSVGIKELKDQYKEVAIGLDTPAAKLVSFSINTYYNKMSMRELERLATEFKKNPVALYILKSRVKAYVYNNFLDYKKKQQIASYLGLKISPQISSKTKC